MLSNNKSYIIDVRCHGKYVAGHPPGAFHFPWDEMQLLACGLPDRNSRLQVVIEEGSGSMDPECVLAFFQRMKYKSVELHDVSYYTSHTVAVPGGCPFEPNGFLAEAIGCVESGLSSEPWKALDVGCGSGRDMVYLAKRGWLVCGLENRARLLHCAVAVSRKFGVNHRVFPMQCDVSIGCPIRDGGYQLLHCCRFIHRSSFPLFTEKLATGGFVIYSHFLEGCEKTAVGHPKTVSGFFLRGELEKMLQENGISILRSVETELYDGRPMIHVLGRKA